MMMILGEDPDKETSLREDKPKYAILMLIALPIITAFGTLAMKKMRKMHESVVSAYSNLTMSFLMIFAVWASG